MKFHGFTILALLAFAFGSATVHARPNLSRSARMDNSRQNALLLRRSATADDQPNDLADRLMAAKVRRVIVKDDMLSIYAHNVKVIVSHGTVTLQGPVHSQSEKLELAADVAMVVSPTKIVDRITVA